ncbi:MAG TPA: hypothetical protein VIL74_05410 [Pyrinomonadaceae bacterium]|jgi:cytoskeletal protein RodZ
MKEDYLWDKTGADAEIEGLENALKAFRFEETAPPALPQTAFAIEKEKPRVFWRFGLAFAAFACLLTVFSIVWFQLGARQTPGDAVVSEINPALDREKAADETFIEKTTPPAEKPVRATTSAAPKIVKIARKSAPAARPVKAVTRRTVTKAPAETLTAEEKYAYNQLMLALSITGSQLKIVKDKVQGIEDKNAARESAK